MADVYMAGDLRNNTTFELDGNVFPSLDCLLLNTYLISEL